jgi:hypothetical protein
MTGASGEEDSEEDERSTRPTSSGTAQADSKSKESSGTKRKAEVLSTESGKIGVTITTNHAHKSPRMTSPSRSPSYADNFIKSLHLTPVRSSSLMIDFHSKLAIVVLALHIL